MVFAVRHGDSKCENSQLISPKDVERLDRTAFGVGPFLTLVELACSSKVYSTFDPATWKARSPLCAKGHEKRLREQRLVCGSL